MSSNEAPVIYDDGMGYANEHPIAPNNRMGHINEHLIMPYGGMSPFNEHRITPNDGMAHPLTPEDEVTEFNEHPGTPYDDEMDHLNERAVTPENGMAHFNSHPGTPDNGLARSNSPVPSITLTASNGENIPVIPSNLIDDFLNDPEILEFYGNAMAASVAGIANPGELDSAMANDSSTLDQTDSTMPNNSTVNQVHVLQSSFGAASTAPDAFAPPPRMVSPQHVTPHAAPLSFSQFDQRYWQGFSDGVNARGIKPVLAAGDLPPTLRGGQASHGSVQGYGDFRQPAVFRLGPHGVVTAPTTPDDPELNQETASGVNAKRLLDQKVGYPYP